MSWWALLALLFAAWCAATWAVVARYSAEDARNGIPKDQRRGVSGVPGIPLGPLVMWGIAALIDLIAEPWGTGIVGSLHAIWLIFSVVVVMRAIWLLRALEKNK